VSFDVARDMEGVRHALEEIFEEDFVRAHIDRESQGAAPETRLRMERQIPRRTLSPGYYRWAEHLLFLDSIRKAGILLGAGDLTANEVQGLVALDRARVQFGYKRPTCPGCGMHQENRFGIECRGCGFKFQRKKR
jgi:hypothetical protein